MSSGEELTVPAPFLFWGMSVSQNSKKLYFENTAYHFETFFYF